MDYMREINAFDRWLEHNYLPASSQLLWYRLMALCNRCGWPEWITVDNQRMMVLIQCKREATLIDTRNKLIESGLVDFRKGRKGLPNQYKMIPFTFTSVVKSEVESVVNTVVETVVQSVVETVDIPSYPTDTRETKTKPNKTRSSTRAVDSPGFDVFWDAYPRKVSKPHAIKAWNKLKPGDDLVQTILGAIRDQAKSAQWLRDDGQYIPHPATWLNNRRWEDEVIVNAAKPDGVNQSGQDHRSAVYGQYDGLVDRL